MRVKLKGINRSVAKMADGSVQTYWYAWRGGPRLKGKPGTPEFIASYNEACAEIKKPDGKILQSVIDKYQRSNEFRKLAPRTKADYVKQIKRIEAKWGKFPLSALPSRKTRGAFKGWRDELAIASPRQADYAWTVLAIILAWGLDRGDVDANPCIRGGRAYDVDRNDKVWTDADEAQFLASAPPHLGLALTLALWTGQRQGDLLCLAWGQYDGECIRLRQSKTGTRVVIPVGPTLRERLAQEKKRGPLMLMTSDKEARAWTSSGFRASWRKACIAAGIRGLTFHDIRGSAVTRLSNAGCSVPEIATFTGLSLKDVQEMLDSHYMSRDPAMAKSAVTKLERRTKTAKDAAKGSIISETEKDK
jgi:integrase